MLHLDKETERSLGSGFIAFSNNDEASSAMEMNGQEINGRSIRMAIVTNPFPEATAKPTGFTIGQGFDNYKDYDNYKD